MRHAPRSQQRSRTHALACVCACVLALAGAAAWAAQPASSTTLQLSLNVTGATTLDASGCTSNPLAQTLGIVQPGGTVRTPQTCSVVFGSPNTTAGLRIRQFDGTGTAMTSGSAFAPQLSSARGAILTQGESLVIAGTGPTSNAVRSSDDGTSWSPLTIPGASFAIAAAEEGPDGRLWFVGAGGNIRSSGNDGADWNVEASGTATDLTAIAWASPSIGWAVGDGGLILATSDGGDSWAAQTSGTTEDLTSLLALSTTRVLATGANGTILETLDGGATPWNALTSNTGSDLHDIDSVDGQDIVAVGSNGTIMRTSDGGGLWSAASTNPYGAGDHLSAVMFSDADTVFTIGGFDDAILGRSTDRGDAWTLTDTQIIGWDLAYSPDSDIVIAAGVNGEMFGYHHASGMVVQRGMPLELRGAAYTSEDTAWIAGGTSGVWRTTDRGARWQPVSSGSGYRVLDLDAVSDNVAGVVGYDGSASITSDGGQTWVQGVTSTATLLYGVALHDAQTAWAVGLGGEVQRTVDGVNWTSIGPGGGIDLYAVAAASANDVWISGNNGTLYRSNNGGDNWTPQDAETTESLRALHAVDANVIWAVGNNGTIIRTTDGGTNWDPITAPGAPDLRGVDAIDAQTAVISGYSGYMRLTTDGGATWTDVNSGGPGSTDDVEEIAMFDEDRILAVFGPSRTATITNLSAVPDYGVSGANFASTDGAFGACLESATLATATAEWDNVPGTCETVDSDPWNAIPTGLGESGSVIASTTTPGEEAAQAAVRFGARAPMSAPAGRYAASIVFEVVAADIS